MSDDRSSAAVRCPAGMPAANGIVTHTGPGQAHVSDLDARLIAHARASARMQGTHTQPVLSRMETPAEGASAPQREPAQGIGTQPGKGTQGVRPSVVATRVSDEAAKTREEHSKEDQRALAWMRAESRRASAPDAYRASASSGPVPASSRPRHSPRPAGWPWSWQLTEQFDRAERIAQRSQPGRNQGAPSRAREGLG